jgi:hypothetical protein
VTKAFTPHGYQREAMRFLYDVPRCALAPQDKKTYGRVQTGEAT